MHESPSRTAFVVAKSLVLVGSSPATSELVDPGALAFARSALAMAGQGAFVRRMRHVTFRGLLRCYEWATVPGIALHHVLRKQVIERKARKALSSGIHQVIQIGAGFDSLCFRLHREWPDAKFVEIDHPATLAVKRRVLESMGAEANLSTHSLDLGSGEMDGVCRALWEKPFLLIAEGVLMYLPVSIVSDCLRTWSRRAVAPSRLLLTFMDGPGFQNQSALADAWLRRAGEPFLWHTSPQRLASMLLAAGWELQTIQETREEENGENAARGEWIADASRPRKEPVKPALPRLPGGDGDPVSGRFRHLPVPGRAG